MSNLDLRVSTVEASAIAFAIYHDNAMLSELNPSEFIAKDMAEMLMRVRACHGEHGDVDYLRLVSIGVDMNALQRLHELRTSSTSRAERIGELLAAHAFHRFHETARAMQALCSCAPFTMRQLAQEASTGAEVLLGIAASVRIDDNRSSMLAGFEEHADEVENVNQFCTIRLGIEDLDARIRGGMRSGEFGIILGRSGHGKSSLALTTALVNAREGLRVLYVSREMLRSELSMRFACALSGENWSSVDDGLSDPTGAYRARMCDMLSKLTIDIDDRASHIDAIRSVVERERAAGKPYSLVVIDFLQMIGAPGEEQHQRFEYLAYACKDLAVNSRCVVIGLAQCNRVGGKADGLPSMHDIRGSSAFENAADVVISMVRGDAPEDFDYPIALKVEKARNGRPGELAKGIYALGQGTFLCRQVQSERANVETL